MQNCNVSQYLDSFVMYVSRVRAHNVQGVAYYIMNCLTVGLKTRQAAFYVMTGHICKCNHNYHGICEILTLNSTVETPVTSMHLPIPVFEIDHTQNMILSKGAAGKHKHHMQGKM